LRYNKIFIALKKNIYHKAYIRLLK